MGMTGTLILLESFALLNVMLVGHSGVFCKIYPLCFMHQDADAKQQGRTGECTGSSSEGGELMKDFFYALSKHCMYEVCVPFCCILTGSRSAA